MKGLDHYEYCGDGVYASTDGYHIWLHVGDHRNEPVVALEPEVMANLVMYSQRLAALAKEAKAPNHPSHEMPRL